MNKRPLILAMLLAMGMIISCSDEKEQPFTPPVEQPEETPSDAPTDWTTIVAALPDSSADLDLKWKETDFLTVVGKTTSRFEIDTVSDDGKIATFKGDPVEGETFKVIYSDRALDYLTRSYGGQSNPAVGDDLDANIRYDAVLEGLSDYTKISFDRSWAIENNVAFSHTGVLLLDVELPDDCIDVRWAKFVASGSYFSTNNKRESEKTFVRAIAYSKFMTPTNGRLQFYYMTSMNEDVIPAGAKMHLVLESSAGAFVRELVLSEDFKIASGVCNTITFDKTKWQKMSLGGYVSNVNADNEWKGVYVNVSHPTYCVGCIVDGVGNNIYKSWQYPWHTGSNTVYDTSFGDWLYKPDVIGYDIDIQKRFAKAPMVGIVNLGTPKVLHSIRLERIPITHQHVTGTTYAEVWASNDTSNDGGFEDYLNKNLTSGVVQSDIDGKWMSLWRSKVWVKLSDVTFGNTSGKLEQTKDLSAMGYKAKYIMIVLRENPNHLENTYYPCLSMNEMYLRYFN